MAKPNKAISKRIKVTGTGKLIRRHTGLDHFNAKERRRIQRRQSASVLLTGTLAKALAGSMIR